MKIKAVLRARHKDNKARKYGLGTVKLNDSELASLSNEEEQLSHTFFQKYYAWCRAKGVAISEGVDSAQDTKRAVKMHEGTVEKHFNGEYGLGAELIDAGVMDPETKVITDPRRVLTATRRRRRSTARRRARARRWRSVRGRRCARRTRSTARTSR